MRKLYNDILTFGNETVFGEHIAVCEGAAVMLHRLVKGNREYQIADQNPSMMTQNRRTYMAELGQTPCAVVVCCADSRVPAEHIFHAGLGELFVIRNAGNVMGTYDLGSIEYAVEHLNVQLVLIMGHTNCGAVGSAMMNEVWSGALAEVLKEVGLAIGDERDPREAERKNLIHSMKRLGESGILRELHQEGKVEFAGAIYDIRTGKVEFLGENGEE